jgi:hypothetical protein
MDFGRVLRLVSSSASRFARGSSVDEIYQAIQDSVDY